MDISQALTVFDALSQPTRLAALRRLVRAGPGGMPAGALAEALDTAHNTLSFHLGHLARAGVVAQRREGRSIIYAANFETIRALIGFLVSDCCSEDVACIREAAGGRSLIELNDCCNTGEESS